MASTIATLNARTAAHTKRPWQPYSPAMLGERLRNLDNRVLKIDQRRAEFATEDGWRRFYSRWRWPAVGAVVCLGVPFALAIIGQHSLFTLMPIGGLLAFQAGAMKAEDDRLNRRGAVERLRPPGL